MNIQNLSTLKIHKLTKEQYERELAAGRLDESALYLTPDDHVTIEQLNGKADIDHGHALKDIENLQTSLDELLTDAKEYTDAEIAKKADVNHNHDADYYTKVQIDEQLVSKSDSTHKHDDDYDTKGAASEVLISAQNYTDEKIAGKADKEHSHDTVYYTQAQIDEKLTSKSDSTHNHDTAYDAVGSAEQALTSAQAYTDEKVANLLNNSSEAVDSIMELAEAMKTNDDVVSALTEAVGKKAEKATTLAGYGITDAYTAEQVDNKIGILTAEDVGALPDTTVIPSIAGLASTEYVDTQLETKASTGHTHSQYLTNIPDEYITETELNAKGYLTQHQSLADYAKTTYVDQAIAAIPTPDVSGQINTHNTSGEAHSDIRQAIDTKASTSDLTAHTDNKSNPHGVTLSQLGVTATATEVNYTKGVTSNIQTQLNKKAGDYSLEIYNGTGGNPKPVKFMTVNYSTCGSENGVAIKLGMVSGHGNGSSYAFLEDAIIRVSYLGTVEVDNFKYYGASTGTYDGANRYYGDIFWVINTETKIVDFYVLMGQYARIQMTPYKRVTYSTGGTITQYTSCTVYSSGDKSWANNSEITLMSDLNAHNSNSSAHSDIRTNVDSIDARLSALEASVVAVHSGDAIPPSSIGENGDIYLYTGE